MGPIAREEWELVQTDSKYRLYVGAIDRALKIFESTTEWADLIAALGKLNKVIGQHAKYQIIPRRLKISKRLAQCMHPNLPFGVHLKALETYDLIFKSIGTNRLSHELFIYSAGLFPLFGCCAMKVRPDLLTIYETHFVPLGIRLRPALPGFLSGVLPGCEEDSTDRSGRTNKLLETICEGVGPTHFYGCVWDCIASNSNVRLPALVFVLSHFDKKKTTEDQPHIMGTDIETMVCGLIACIQDKILLVQRYALDLLILGFPLYNSHLTTDDMIRLVTAAISTIPRREQSLNRRIFAWLLGMEVNMTMLAHYPQIIKAKAENKVLTYFEVFSRPMLVKALTIILDNAIGERPFALHPYQLLISLLDKDGLGPAILDDILLEYFRLLYLSYYFDPKANVTELLNEANYLFNSIEQKFLLTYIGQLFTKACSKPYSTCLDVENPVRRVASGDAGVVEICTLTEFLLDKVPAFDTSPDTHKLHLPTLFHQMVSILSDNCDKLNPMQIIQALNLCSKILNRVQPLIVGHHNDNDDSSDTDSSIINSPSNYQFESVSSDPIQNSVCSSVDDRSELSRDDTELTVEKTDSLLELCMRQYERFYVNFIYSLRERVGERRTISSLIDSLSRGSNNNEEMAKRYENLLDDILHLTASTHLPEQHCSSNEHGKDWVEPLKKASSLLVDLSTLRTFLKAPLPRGLFEPEGLIEETAIESLPEWLCVLMTCSCWFNKSSHLQIASIAAILELVSLCTTAQFLVSKSTADDGVTPVLIRPLLKPSHLKYMEKNTFIFEAMCHWLWQQLDVTDHKVQSVELLYKLHSAFPARDIVETCIGVYLEPHHEKSQYQSTRLDSFRKFSALWNIGRDINSKRGNSLCVSDIFYKSMLKMLDNFKLPGCDSLKTEAQEWLFHSLIRGDIHRILDPILSMLLNPSTARISVLHIRINSDSGLDASSLQSTTPEDQIVTLNSCVDGKAPNPVKLKGHKAQSKGKIGGSLISVLTAAIASPPVQHKQKFSSETKVNETTNDSSSVSLSINSFAGESSTVNTDFDEFFEEVTADKSSESSSKGQLTSQLVVRNRSFPSLNKEAASYGYFGFNEALRNTSIDFLSLSDSIMTKISDGELPFNRFRPGSLSSDRISNMLPSQDCGDLIKSWAYPSKEAEGSDLEESTAADEYFSSDKDSMSIVDEVISDLLDKVSERTSKFESKKEPSPEFKRSHRKLQYQQSFTSHPSNIDPLHAHMLLYKNRYDVETVLYCLETLKNILLQQPRPFLIACASTKLVPRSSVLNLLARHKKSLFGRGFSGDLEDNNIRSAMYLEVVILACLYYIRSYYPEPSPSTQRDIDNKGVQISSTEVLTLLCTELIRIVREGTLASYLSDVFSRLKVFKIILHSVLTNINNRKTSSQPLTHHILKFNNAMDCNSSERLSHTSETLIKQQIKLLLALIILEHETAKMKGELSSSNLVDRQLDSNETKYINGRPIPQQPLFMQVVHKLLENHASTRFIHSQLTSLITCSLPYMGSALSRIVTTALKQICINIEASSECYSSSCSLSFPPDYSIVMLESLTIMCHYCLLDSASSSLPLSSMGSDDIAYSEVFKNLTHLYMPALTDHKERSDGRLVAKKAVLSHLPRVISSISTLWHALVNRKDRESTNCEVGSPRLMKVNIIEFLNPLADQHASSFLAAMAVVWRERSQPLPASMLSMVLPEACENQKVLIQLLIGIKEAMPLHVLAQTLNQVVKQPAVNQESAITVEISSLELFVNYVQHVQPPTLLESWPSLLQLFRDAPSLSPPALFLMMGTLSHLVHRCKFNDKKDIKDLQDVTVKLIEACTTIVGACLEQTTWIRKNLAVREEDPNPTLIREDKANDLVVSETPTSEGKTKKGPKSERKKVARKLRQDTEKLQIRTMHQWFVRAFVNDGSLPLDYADRHRSGSNSLAQYSINALNVLAHLLAPLLEKTFGSQEKERVTILNNLMVNVVPYLKNHTQRNAASYYACSQLLASITSYQYARKASKKDVIELLFDPAFFQMEPRSLQSWKIITDNIISQETSTFKDFMSRVNVPQGSSFGIFNSREAEYEQRAQLLKRLAFVIYCSEIDKFANCMPEFQERLTESTKIPHNGVLAQVFLCFRAMLLRMSPNIIIPLWPAIISEILQVMTLMERELSSEFENYSSNVRSLLDWNWVTNNGSNSQALWLQLQLAAASLLFLAVQLPADRLPQFQMYRWAFVGGDNGSNSRAPVSVTPDFVPHVVKIAELMDAKFGTLEALPTPLLPTPAQLTTAEELHPFFCAMRSGRYTPLTVTQLEHQLELDILDSMSVR